jgi:hypothetical protein
MQGRIDELLDRVLAHYQAEALKAQGASGGFQ